MKKLGYLIYFAIILTNLTSVQLALADGSRKTTGNDVKIKTRQTMSGQTYENTTYIKGKRQRTERNMGGMESVDITQCDLKRSLRIMPQAQTYMVDAWQTADVTTEPTQASGKTQPKTKGGVVTSTVTTKDTGERKQMFGYTAKHIITTMETNSSPDACNVSKSKMQMDGWYIDAAFVLDCETDRYSNYRPAGNNGGCQDRYEMKQIGAAIKKGYPVLEKMTMFDESGKETMTMLNEVVELSGATLDAALFDVPNGYREVKDSSELYASMSSKQNSISGSTNNAVNSNSSSSDSGMSNNIKNLANSTPTANSQVVPKEAGVVRIGLASVKPGSVGEGINAQELAGAIQNSLLEYVKTPKVEIVALEAKLPSAITDEAQSKECDYVVYATVSHKKGGGGFGMFKKIAPALGNTLPLGGLGGSVAGQVAGRVTSTVLYTAATMASSVKSKDEVSLDIKMQNVSGAAAFAKQYKGKAKSDGEDIITPLIEDAAQEIINATGN